MAEVIGVSLTAKTTDNKQYVQATSRPIGTIVSFTSRGDSTDSPVAIGGGAQIAQHHSIGDPADCTVMVDYNVKENRTFIREGYITYTNMQFDCVTVDVVPKVTDVTSGSETYFDLYGGYLIIPAAGTGTINLAGTPNLVERPISIDYGVREGSGYWNAPYDTTTHTFGDLTACPAGDGTYNMFAAEVPLSRFVNSVCFQGSGGLTLESSDAKEIPHGTRLKISCKTNQEMDLDCDGTSDHAWSAAVILSLFREKLC